MSSQSTIHPRRLPLARRYALLLEALPTIEGLAHRYSYSFSLHTLEADDLAQIGCLEALEAMQKGRMGANKVGYLVGVARFAMLRYCGEHKSLIRTPHKHDGGYQEAPLVLSLDMPLGDDSDQTLLDLLADDGDAYNAAYDAYLDSLPV